MVGSSNCESLHDMSLFHNLKLKRRKVDSRGSSDGKFPSGDSHNDCYSSHVVITCILWKTFSKKSPVTTTGDCLDISK